MKEYHFYMQRATSAGVGTGDAVDLEQDFDGLLYVECSGLEAVGEPKNIYTEDYAEADGLRVYHPADQNEAVTHKATTVKLTLLFVEGQRRAGYAAFCEFVSSGRIFYWDNARNKKVFLVLQKEVAPEKDRPIPEGYIMVSFEFTNLWGIGKECDDNGDLV